MNARRQGPPGSQPDVGQVPSSKDTPGAGPGAAPGAGPGGAPGAGPGGAQGNGEQSRNPLPTRVPANKMRRAIRDLPGRQFSGQVVGGATAGLPSRMAAAASLAAGAGASALRSVGLGGTDADLALGLSTRLTALARMIQIGNARSGREGFSSKLLGQAEDVLGRAGERMRLSSAHTVVVLAGGTGSGKSSLFNCLAGADFSTVGVTRPITREAHACIWDGAGSGPLLEWLGVPQRNRYSRASALGAGEAGLAGLVLLDLPDHDSVMGHAAGQVDRLVSLADVMIWVLDPQKYADAAVHRQFLVPLAQHSEVQAVVLNQADLLTAAQVDDCVADLRRLLDLENLADVPILATSAVTGSGLDELRELLAEGVTVRHAAAARISADLDTVVARFAPYAGEPGSAPDAEPVLADGTPKLVDQFYAAAGVTAVGDTLRSARELRAVDFVGWPVAWLIQRLAGRDPLRKVRLGKLWNDLRSVSAGPTGAQQAAIDNSLNEFGDRLAEPLPKPWSQTVRAAARSRADAIPTAVGEAINEVVPSEDSIEGWWRAGGLLQGVLLGVVAIALAWLIAVVVVGVFHVGKGLPTLLSNPMWIGWAALAAAIALAAGAITASACLSSVRKQAIAENDMLAARIRKRIEDIAREMAVIPAEQELSEFGRYREEFSIASAGAERASDS
jgi:GTP-binding protein EngB required for normal cell division